MNTPVLICRDHRLSPILVRRTRGECLPRRLPDPLRF